MIGLQRNHLSGLRLVMNQKKMESLCILLIILMIVTKFFSLILLLEVIHLGTGIDSFLKVIEKEFPDDKKAVETYLSEMQDAEKYFKIT